MTNTNSNYCIQRTVVITHWRFDSVVCLLPQVYYIQRRSSAGDTLKDYHDTHVEAVTLGSLRSIFSSYVPIAELVVNVRSSSMRVYTCTMGITYVCVCVCVCVCVYI